MNAVLVTLGICLVLGVVGAFIRVAIQWRRDGVVPVGDGLNLSLLVETFIGAVAGGVSWLLFNGGGPPETVYLPGLYLASLALGYSAPDALENILKTSTPV